MREINKLLKKLHKKKDKLIKEKRLQPKDCTDNLLKIRHAYNAAQRVSFHSRSMFYQAIKQINIDSDLYQKKKLVVPTK
jgi:hypothetical protein